VTHSEMTRTRCGGRSRSGGQLSGGGEMLLDVVQYRHAGRDVGQCKRLFLDWSRAPYVIQMPLTLQRYEPYDR
jgi:hypothetical protein